MKYALGLVASLGAVALPLAGCGGDDGPRPPLFEPRPECEGDAIVPFAGDHQNVISFIEIGDAEDGFDLDGADDLDGPDEPDNKLAAVGSLAREAIEDALTEYELIIPFEFFDLDGTSADECVKFGVYLGVYKQDGDEDGRDTAVPDGDCDDTRATSREGMPELDGNYVDDDCDGLADEVTDKAGGETPSTDVVDHDADGVTLADGDCDDSVETGAMATPGAAETCGDRLDNDCDGVADGSPDGTTCNPYDETPDEIAVDPLSFEGGEPLIVFDSGRIEGGKLYAGPSIFSVAVPVIDGLTLDLRITGAQIEADVMMIGDSVGLANGRLGGVIDSQTADNIRGLTVEEIGLTPENSLLDAIYANLLGTLLSLKATGPDHAYPGCKMPDIDVDRDGLEVFCDSDPNDDDKSVDICIDGDGTVITDADAGGDCTDVTDEATGRPRFADGISVELNFSTVPTILRE